MLRSLLAEIVMNQATVHIRAGLDLLARAAAGVSVGDLPTRAAVARASSTTHAPRARPGQFCLSQPRIPFVSFPWVE